MGLANRCSAAGGSYVENPSVPLHNGRETFPRAPIMALRDTTKRQLAGGDDDAPGTPARKRGAIRRVSFPLVRPCQGLRALECSC